MAGGLTDTELAARANQAATILVPKLLPNAQLSGGKAYYEVGSIDGEKGQSLKINLKSEIGRWTDFSAPDGTPERAGDIWNLAALVRFGGTDREAKAKAAAWIKSTLGLDDLNPDRLAAVRREIAEKQKRIDREAEAAEASRARSAWFMWKEAVELPGTPAEAYLRGRMINFRRLGHVPGVLRYRPDVWCPYRSPAQREKFPALLAAIVRHDPAQRKLRHVGTHRTFLNLDGWDHAHRTGAVTVVKVPNAKGKLKSHKHTLGSYAGGHIPLWKGTHNCSLWDVPEGTRVYVSEGIEDGASIAMAYPDRRIVAAVAIANMGGMEFPPQVGPIVFITQNDPEDSKAVAALERAVQRQQEAGRTVELLPPPPGYKDFNDLLCGKRMA